MTNENNKIRNPVTRIVFVLAAGFALAGVVAGVGVVSGQADGKVAPTPGGKIEKKPWNADNAVAAFTAALTRAGYDKKFRERLNASPASARRAVAEEGKIDIPKDKVILFHEKENNENYHVFYLPPLSETGEHKPYLYKDYFQCCYSQWLSAK